MFINELLEILELFQRIITIIEFPDKIKLRNISDRQFAKLTFQLYVLLAVKVFCED